MRHFHSSERGLVVLPNPLFTSHPAPIMPFPVKTEEEIQRGLALLEPQFATLMEEKDVNRLVRAVLGLVGVKRHQTLAGLASTEELARTRLETFLGVVEDDGFEAMIQISGLLETWRAARARSAAHEEAQAEAAASGRLRDVPHVENRGMRQAHERKHGEVEDHEYPSRDYLGWRIAQFETGQIIAEQLDQVVDHERAGDERQDPSLALQFTPGCNKVTAIRKSVSAPTPKTTEKLRDAYQLMKRHWEVIRLRYPDRQMFQGYTSEVWDDLIRHLLGPKIHLYRSRKGWGISWEDLLEYEFQIRKKAYKQVTKQGTTLQEALREAMDCEKLKQEYFTLQLCTSGQKYPEESTKKTNNNTNAGNADEDGKRRRELDDEMNQIKKLRQQLTEQVRARKGSKGPAGKGQQWSQPSQSTEKAGGKGSGKGKQDSLRGKWNEIKKREIIEMKLPGSNKMICVFYQYHGCRNSDDQCSYTHICARCHRPGHAAIDPECRGTPRMK